MMRGILAALLVWLIAVSPVWAEGTQTEAELRALLSAGVEQTVSPAQLERLGKGVSEALIAIYEKPTEPRYVRLRALSSLGRRKDEKATRFLLTLLHASTLPAPQGNDFLHPARSALVLRRAIEGLTARKLAEAETDLTLSLGHPDVWVRSAAVKALRAYGKVSTERTLTLHLQRETSARVKFLITDRSALPTGPRSNAPESAPPPR